MVEATDGILAIGSGSDYAEAAAHALRDMEGMTAMDIGGWRRRQWGDASRGLLAAPSRQRGWAGDESIAENDDEP